MFKAEAVVCVERHFLLIAEPESDWDGEWSNDPFARGRPPGVAPGVVSVLGPRAGGRVPVFVEVLETSPVDAPEHFQRIVEASIELSGDIVWIGDQEFVDDDPPLHVELGSGCWRVRVLTADVDTVRDDECMGAEHHVIQFFRGPRNAPTVVRDLETCVLYPRIAYEGPWTKDELLARSCDASASVVCSAIVELARIGELATVSHFANESQSKAIRVQAINALFLVRATEHLESVVTNDDDLREHIGTCLVELGELMDDEHEGSQYDESDGEDDDDEGEDDDDEGEKMLACRADWERRAAAPDGLDFAFAIHEGTDQLYRIGVSASAVDGCLRSHLGIWRWHENQWVDELPSAGGAVAPMLDLRCQPAAYHNPLDGQLWVLGFLLSDTSLDADEPALLVALSLSDPSRQIEIAVSIDSEDHDDQDVPGQLHAAWDKTRGYAVLHANFDSGPQTWTLSNDFKLEPLDQSVELRSMAFDPGTGEVLALSVDDEMVSLTAAGWASVGDDERLISTLLATDLGARCVSAFLYIEEDEEDDEDEEVEDEDEEGEEDEYGDEDSEEEVEAEDDDFEPEEEEPFRRVLHDWRDGQWRVRLPHVEASYDEIDALAIVGGQLVCAGSGLFQSTVGRSSTGIATLRAQGNDSSDSQASQLTTEVWPPGMPPCSPLFELVRVGPNVVLIDLQSSTRMGTHIYKNGHWQPFSPAVRCAENDEVTASEAGVYQIRSDGTVRFTNEGQTGRRVGPACPELAQVLGRDEEGQSGVVYEAARNRIVLAGGPGLSSVWSFTPGENGQGSWRKLADGLGEGSASAIDSPAGVYILASRKLFLLVGDELQFVAEFKFRGEHLMYVPKLDRLLAYHRRTGSVRIFEEGRWSKRLCQLPPEIEFGNRGRMSRTAQLIYDESSDCLLVISLRGVYAFPMPDQLL